MKVSPEADTAIGISVAHFSKTKRILAIAGLERKPTLFAVNLISGAGLAAKSFEAAVDADRIVVGLLPPIHIWNAHYLFALAKSAHHAALTRSESMHPEPMKFIIVRTCQISRIAKADSDRRMARWLRCGCDNGRKTS